MTEMKSTWPSVAHCSLTGAPSCSTSLLTSRIRCGLFLTVWTPSGVRVESMMYVGMRSFYPIRVFRGARPLDLLASGPSMRRLATALPLALLLVPAAAHGAAVQTDRTCYLQT